MKRVMGLLLVMIIVLVIGLGLKDESCKRPLPWHKQHCAEMEQAILGATVRFALHGWIEVETGYDFEQIKGTISHATVVDGRYLP